jgi:hypothetical protein
VFLVFAPCTANKGSPFLRENWPGFANRHGDWGRDAALWLGRRAGRLSLAGLGKFAGGLDYALASKAAANGIEAYPVEVEANAEYGDTIMAMVRTMSPGVNDLEA